MRFLLGEARKYEDRVCDDQASWRDQERPSPMI